MAKTEEEALAECVAGVRAALRELIERSPYSLRALDTRFGVGKNFFSGIFSGRKELRVSHVYMVLRAVGADPGAFWASIHGSATANTDLVAPRLAEDDERLNALIESKVEEALGKLRKPRGGKAPTKGRRLKHG